MLVILGPTGSGKTSIGIKIAKMIKGEIISADSRAIYKGMDIGTAKPTREEMQGIPHYGIDLVEPGERFTVYDWKSFAESKIAEIKAHGKVPVIVGGTGLYIDALVYDYQFRGPTGEKIGDIEQKTCSDRKEIKGDFILIGVKLPSDVLRERLSNRITQMFTPELYSETKKLVQKYGWENGAMTSNIYKHVWDYLEGNLSLEEAKRKSFYDDWHLAKRQMTWFKRNPEIVWLPPEKVCSYAIKQYNNYQKSCYNNK